MSPLPLFYILSFPLVLPKLCKCVHSTSTGPECSWASPTPPPTPSPQAPPHPHPPHSERLSLPLCSLHLADSVTLYRTLFIMVLASRAWTHLTPPLAPPCGLPLV